MKNKLVRQIPNGLTVIRLILTLIFLGMVLYAPRFEDPKPWRFLIVAFVLFVIAGITDLIDGSVARYLNVTSKFGRMIDPLADKVLVCGAFFCFAWIGQPLLANFTQSPYNVPPWALDAVRWGTAIILFVREVGVTILRHIAEARGVEFGAVFSGKIKMSFQSFGIGTVMIGWAFVSREWGDWFTIVTYFLMLLLTVVSGIHSLTRRITPESTPDE
ncbi:MAG: CDP-alcohol phosphatidyltransferase family protein [Sedimentisphaerales bacterium]|nr:CDP-alcohol phosphatidyltransferase family protein [Sedimentisphaerales bacterium]